MKVRMNKATWRALCSIVGSFILVVSFQNCGKAGFDSALDDNIEFGSSDAELNAKYGQYDAPKVAAIPFGFDTVIDQISYNSCATPGLNTQTNNFSFMAGSYDGGGVSLTTAFHAYMDSTFPPVYPSPTITPEQIKGYLKDSPTNKDATPVLAIRTMNGLRSIHTTNGSSVLLGKDVIPMLGNLTDPLISDSIATKGTVANYFPFSNELKLVEGKLNFNADEPLSRAVREDLMNSGILTLSYLDDPNDVTSIRSASADQTLKRAYGRGSRMTFANAVSPMGSGSGLFSNNPANILTDITELDLSTGVVVKTWTCAAARRYMVVRAQDQASICPRDSIARMNDAAYRAELAIVRRHLKAEAWDVNIDSRCVVPKSPVSCYSAETINGQASGVQYTRNLECFQSGKADYLGGTIPVKRCAQFVTICNR
ncbi:hypothetical protein D3C72_919850 [compost metagenome]